MKVQAVELNLATRPFKNDTLLWVGLVVAVATLGWVTWWNVQTWREHGMLVADLREGQVNIEARFATLEERDRTALRDIDQVDLLALRTQLEKANEVIRWKSFSWTRLFNLLEQVQPYNVQMSSIHPVFRGDRRAARNEIEDLEQVPVSVEGTAKDLRDLLEFQRNLIFDPHFDRVEPENFATDDNSGETVFRIRFLYDPRVEIVPDAEPPANDGAAVEVADTPSDEEPVAAQAAEEIPPDAVTGEALGLESGEDSPLATAPLKKIRRDGRGKKRQAAEAEGAEGAQRETDAGPQERAPDEPDPPIVERGSRAGESRPPETSEPAPDDDEEDGR